jgi:2,4-dienoyl-CoA reductase-like NADH-dependent reductase (Old Yellow Enzyme family)
MTLSNTLREIDNLLSCIIMNNDQITDNLTILDNPIKLKCGKVVKNRYFLAPLTNVQSNSNGTLHEDEYNWLTSRAGYFGMISTCAAYVSNEGKAWDGQLGVAEDKHIQGLTKLSNGIKSKGSTAIVQLHHAGDRATLSPQKISATARNDVKAATHEDIKRIKSDFVKAGIRCYKAGFDGIEVHGANGYLFTQFLSKTQNNRTDEYGGEIENRARFLLETIDEIRASVPLNFIVAVRLSPVDIFENRGLLLQDTLKVVQWLSKRKVDIIHLSLRDAVAPPPLENSTVPVVQSIKQILPSDVKLATAGGIWTRCDAKKLSELGSDFIVIGKAAIIHENWPEIIKITNFEPNKPPWTEEALKQVNVSNKFIKYLGKGPNGLVK